MTTLLLILSIALMQFLVLFHLIDLLRLTSLHLSAIRETFSGETETLASIAEKFLTQKNLPLTMLLQSLRVDLEAGKTL